MRWIILLFLTMSLAACAVKVTPAADSGERAQHGEHHHGGEGHHERD